MGTIIDAYELANRNAQNIREASMLGALAYAAIHGLVSDEISQVQAYKKYGKEWIKDRTNRRNSNGEPFLHVNRNGAGKTSTKIYSVFEIETLKRAEKNLEEMYQSVINKI